MRRVLFTLAVGCALTTAAHAADPPPAVAASLKTIKAVGPEGAGNEAAAAAWKTLVKSGDDALIPTLKAFAGADPTAANWLRSAVSAIADQAEQAGRVLSVPELTRFVTDTAQNPAARRIAFELIGKSNSDVAAKLLPSFLNDPQPDLRREAVAAEMKRVAPLANRDNLRREYTRLLGFARDEDQVQEVVKQLKENGVEVNLTEYYGLITEWVVSPMFDNTDGAGFAAAYPPEKSSDRTGWQYTQSNTPDGAIDLNKVIGKKKNATAYASATVFADADTAVEVRASSQNAVKVFVNGKEVYSREEYHSGAFLDQHVAAVKLTKGKNEIVVKVCQNDQPQDWAEAWGFSLRLSDGTGAAVKLKQVVLKNGKEITVEPSRLAPTEPKKSDADKKEGQ